MSRTLLLTLALTLTLIMTLNAADETPPAPTTATPPLMWTDLSDWINGAAKGISVAALSPGGDQLIIGMPDRCLLASTDARKTWLLLGKDQAELSKKSWPCQILLDPSDAK